MNLKYTKFFACRRVVLSIFSLIFLSFATQAQTGYKKGYLLKTEGDTIPGLIKYDPFKTKGKKVAFKATSSSMTEGFLPNQIVGFGLTGSQTHYRPINVNEEDMTPSLEFSRLVADGNLVIYKPYSGFVVMKGEEVFRLIIKGLDRENEIFRSNIKRLGRSVVDCNQTLLDDERFRVTEMNLLKLASNYYNCIGGEFKNYSFDPNIAGFTIQPGLSFGINSTSIDPSASQARHFAMANFERTNSFIIGAFARIGSPRFSKKSTFRLGVEYNKREFYGFTRNLGGTPNVNSDSRISADLLRGTLGLDYRFNTGKLQPYVIGGMSLNKYIGQTVSVQEDSIDPISGAVPSVTSRLFDEPIITDGWTPGVWFGFGIEFSLVNSFKTAVEIVYDRHESSRSAQVEVVESNVQILSFDNIQFRISLSL